MTDDEVVSLLERMDSGELPFRVDGKSWDEVYAGDVKFVTAGGHTVVVFNDCGDFDYVDHVLAPDGSMAWDFDLNTKAGNWYPKHLSRWTGETMMSKVKKLFQ